MTIKRAIYITLIILLGIVILSAYERIVANSKKVYKDQVAIHTLGDAQGLNPITVSDATANRYILPNIMQPLMYFDIQTLKLVPVLAKSLPVEKEVGNTIEITYEIRPEAVWDNGSPITAKDVVFTYKCILLPKINSDNIKSAIDYVRDIRLYPDNPKKFTVICNRYIGAAEGTGSAFNIIQEYA